MMDAPKPVDNETAAKPRRGRWRRWLGASALAIVLLAAVAYVGLRWAVELPAPSGEHAVGETALALADASRKDPWIDKSPRELIVYLFYPTADTGSRPSYFPHLGQLAGNFEGSDAVLVRLLPLLLAAHTREDARAKSGKESFPLVLFSPGAGTAVFQYRTLLEDLASRGYVVAAIEPTHEGVGQVFPDGRVREPVADRFRPEFAPDNQAAHTEYYRQRVLLRAADMSFVVDRLAELAARADSPWSGRIGTQRVGAFGHSLGGVAAVEAARRDKRIVAAANLDGKFASFPCLTDPEPADTGAALLFVGKKEGEPADATLAEMGVTRKKWQAQAGAREAKRNRDLAKIFRSVAWVELDRARHTDFSDEPFYSPRLGSSDDDPAVTRLARIRGELAKFFAENLRPGP